MPVIEEFKPDVIISCHAFVTTMLGDLKVKGAIKTPVIALITDFAPHYTYIADGIDHYVVSSDKMVALFKQKYNISPSRVHAFGIPTFDKFAQKVDKDARRQGDKQPVHRYHGQQSEALREVQGLCQQPHEAFDVR